MSVKLAFITPTVYLEKFASQGDIHLILAHLVGDNEYTKYYRKEKKLKILDNGVFEGQSLTSETLITRAGLVDADVVVAPDVLFDCDATIAEFDKFKMALASSKKKYKVFGVPQGKDLNDYIRCHDHMCSRGVDFIGLSILAIPYVFEAITGTKDISINRMVAMNYLENSNMVHPNVKYHCLGLGSYIGEIAEMARHKWIYSNDSCSVFQTANIKSISYIGGYVYGGKPSAKVDFNQDTKFNIESFVQNNIKIIKAFANNK